MLSQTKRLKIQEFINQKPGKISRGQFFLVKTFFQSGKTRIGVSVPKKIFPTAVGRNRLKRVIFNHLQSIFIAISPSSYLIQVLPPASSAKDRAIIEELEKLILD